MISVSSLSVLSSVGSRASSPLDESDGTSSGWRRRSCLLRPLPLPVPLCDVVFVLGGVPCFRCLSGLAVLSVDVLDSFVPEAGLVCCICSCDLISDVFCDVDCLVGEVGAYMRGWVWLVLCVR